MCSESQQRAQSETREFQQFMMNFFQSNPDISQRMTEFQINDAVAPSSHSIFSARTTHSLRSLCESLNLDIVLNSTRVYKMANRNTSTTTFKTKHSSFSQLSGRSLSEISDISVIRLPVYTLELNNGDLYQRSWNRVALEKIRPNGTTDPGRILEKVRKFSLGRGADRQTQHELLLDRGADIRTTDMAGLTALHRASSTGHRYTVRLLLNRGADIETANDDGTTALHKSSARGRGNTVELLLD